jgi:hypothetical protein
MLLSEGEETMLHWLAEEYGLSASDVIRTMIRNEYATRSYENRQIARGHMPPRPLLITSGGPTIVRGADVVTTKSIKKGRGAKAAK